MAVCHINTMLAKLGGKFVPGFVPGIVIATFFSLHNPAVLLFRRLCAVHDRPYPHIGFVVKVVFH